MAKMKKRMEKEEREQDLQTNWCFSLLQILVRWMNIKWHLHAAITASSELCLSLSCVTSVGISESDKDRRRNIVLNSRWRRHGRISFTRIRVPKLRRNTLSSMMSNTHTAEFNEICHFHLNFYTNLFHRWKIVRRRRKWKKMRRIARHQFVSFLFWFAMHSVSFFVHLAHERAESDSLWGFIMGDTDSPLPSGISVFSFVQRMAAKVMIKQNAQII